MSSSEFTWCNLEYFVSYILWEIKSRHNSCPHFCQSPILNNSFKKIREKENKNSLLFMGENGTIELTPWWYLLSVILEFSLYSLCEKYPNAEFFLVLIFPHSHQIRRNTPYLSIFSPYAGKYGPEKTPYLDTFHAVTASWVIRIIKIKASPWKQLIARSVSFQTHLNVVWKTSNLKISKKFPGKSSPGCHWDLKLKVGEFDPFFETL